MEKFSVRVMTKKEYDDIESINLDTLKEVFTGTEREISLWGMSKGYKWRHKPFECMGGIFINNKHVYIMLSM